MHTSLGLRANVTLITIYSVVIIASFIVISPTPWLIHILAVSLGLIGGFFQRRALESVPSEFNRKNSLLEIRRAMCSTKWGRSYLYLLWASSLIIFFVALSYEQEFLICWLIGCAGYFSFSLAREMVTLPVIARLPRMAVKEDRQQS